MIILDENFTRVEKFKLKKFKKSIKQIGFEIEKSGIKDNDIIPFLHKIKNPTFFTLDNDFFNTNLRHKGYSIVWLNVEINKIAEFAIKFLKHDSFNTISKRMGKIVQITTQRVRYWELNSLNFKDIFWE